MTFSWVSHYGSAKNIVGTESNCVAGVMGWQVEFSLASESRFWSSERATIHPSGMANDPAVYADRWIQSAIVRVTTNRLQLRSR